MIDKLLELDAQVLLWIQSHLRDEMWDPLVKGITYLGEWGLLAILGCIVLLAIPKTRRLGITCSVALGLSFICNNLILKNVIARVRPYETVEGLKRLVGAQSDWSFPSGHSGASFSVAFVIFRETRLRIGIPLMILATLIALSRLYVGVHYPTDVIAGALTGILYACIALYVTHKFYARRDAAKPAPEED